MPNRDPEKLKATKHRWYLKHRERIAKEKRERRAAQKKLKLPKPPKPPPTQEQLARARELNRLACNRYRSTHGDQIRALNRKYYHRHRDKIVQQQRDRRARARETPHPFRKLQALADECTARLLEIEHGYARIAPAPQTKEKTGPGKEQNSTKSVSATSICQTQRDGECQGPSPSPLP